MYADLDQGMDKSFGGKLSCVYVCLMEKPMWRWNNLNRAVDEWSDKRLVEQGTHEGIGLQASEKGRQGNKTLINELIGN